MQMPSLMNVFSAVFFVGFWERGKGMRGAFLWVQNGETYLPTDIKGGGGGFGVLALGKEEREAGRDGWDFGGGRGLGDYWRGGWE